mmetsp:Transcript_34298/g.90207  ORF Transcript_34298/g.90207 Transcript_34298/m.90207 type:complete len:87 (+) Transcript_34298:689-949(+)
MVSLAHLIDAHACLVRELIRSCDVSGMHGWDRCGYAIASGGRLHAVAFAFFTFANLAPRARHHHDWYRAKFDNYPQYRRALIPFVW